MSAARHDPTVTFQPIAHAKIAPAPVREATLSRTRLLDRLAEALSCRVTLVVAEAGYGKTTLLADFTRGRAMRCLWYKLESSDRDWVTFVNYLVAAGREAHASFGSATAALLASMAANNPSKELVVSTLLAEFGALGDAPTAFIFDDYHLVDESEDVREIVTRLLKTAPDSLRFVFLSRRRPELPLARLAAQGELAEFDTDELRFSQGETEQLFTEVYRQPLEAEIVAQVDARTEGWAASLQLLHSSIRGRSPAEVRSFVRALSGAQGPLYDFLAEEVLSELPPELQRFLVRASLLERVVPSHAVAVMSTSEPAADEATVVRCITEAERLGLMAKRAATSTSHRFHPLLREFLQRQLIQHVDAEELRAMHLSVARASEEREWLTACHHYIEADQPEQAMRVLGSSVAVAIGTGRWGAAAEIVDRLEGIDPAPAVAVLLARRAIDKNDAAVALSHLQHLDAASSPPNVRALARQARAAVEWRQGNGPGVVDALEETLRDPDTPGPFRELADVHRTLMSSSTANLATLADRLVALGRNQSGENMKFFAGVSFHNAMNAEVARGRYRSAYELGCRAIEEFAATGTGPREAQSTHASLAVCCLELGLLQQMESHREAAVSGDNPFPDAFSDCAYLSAVVGDTERAELLWHRAKMIEAAGEMDIGSTVANVFARAMLDLTRGNPSAAAAALANFEMAEFEIGSSLALVSYSALTSVLLGNPDASQLVEEGLDRARRQGARRWDVRLRVLKAVVSGDGAALRASVGQAAAAGNGALLELADVLVTALDRLTPLPVEVEQSIEQWPARWLPLLRRQITRGYSNTSLASAAALDRFGTTDDVALLRAFDKTYLRGSRARGFGQGLARRLGPILVVSDLGRSNLRVGPRTVPLTQMRRRAASLVAFLVTRSSHTATREQVLEGLWPELAPEAAVNSLNQTLYFVRRDIDPWYEDDISLNYVHLEGDLVWLDPDLTSVESSIFLAQALGVTAREPLDEELGREAFERYRGRFAPEFEYEEWSIPWRDRLHAVWLHLCQTLRRHLVSQNRLAEATELSQRALTIEPDNLELHGSLVWLYASLGAASAASEEYATYASLHRDELGIEPPPLPEVASVAPPTLTGSTVHHATEGEPSTYVRTTKPSGLLPLPQRRP